MSDKTRVEVVNLNKSFEDVHAVRDVNFSFESGEIHGFIGKNGAGKTTSMRIISTLEHPDSGDVLIDNISCISEPLKVRPVLGFMPDYLDSYKNMMVDDYLDFYARAYELPPEKRQSRIDDIVEFTGMKEMYYRPVHGLSKGWKQRLSLARVLINDPKVLILDEPAAGLDPQARIEIHRLLRILADNNKAILISSHILHELSEICDSVTIIERGQVKASGNLASLQEEMDQGRRVEVHLDRPNSELTKKLQIHLCQIPEIKNVTELNSGASFTYHGDDTIRAKILSNLIKEDFMITDYHSAGSSLVDAFINFTKDNEETNK